MLEHTEIVEIKNKLEKYFSDLEINEIAFEFDYNLREQGQGTKIAEIIDLIYFVQRNGHLRKFLEELKKRKPHIEWPTMEISVPFVIVAMTKREVKGLIDGTAFKKKTEHKKFQEFLNSINKIDPNSLENYYGEKPEDWHPFFNPKTSMNDFIEAIISIDWFEKTKFNKHTDSWHSDLSDLIIKHNSERFFSQTENRPSNPVWNELKEDPCLFIIDAVSLFHPTIKKEIKRSKILDQKNTAVIFLSPIDIIEDIPANKLTIQQIKKYCEEIYEARYVDLIDSFVEICVGSPFAFTRHLVTMTHMMRPIIRQTPQSRATKQLIQQEGESKYQQVLFGGLG